MKGEKTLKILEAIEEVAMDMGDLLAVFLTAGYGTSYGKLQYELSKRKRNRYLKSREGETEKQFRQKYHDLVYRLKRDGLIEQETKEGRKFFAITKKGQDKLYLLKERAKRKLPEISYQKEGNHKFTLIAFDIPEKEKIKREWLRAVLKNLGLQMIQKSVWAGKVKIPKRFLDDLAHLKLLDFVEIFEISKTGSLKHIA